MKTSVQQVEPHKADWSGAELLPFNGVWHVARRNLAWYEALAKQYPALIKKRRFAPLREFLSAAARFVRDFKAGDVPEPDVLTLDVSSWCEGAEPALDSRELLCLCVMVDALASTWQGRKMASNFIRAADAFIEFVCEREGWKPGDVYAAARQRVLNAATGKFRA